MAKLDDSHMTATTPAGILPLLLDSLGFFVSPFGRLIGEYTPFLKNSENFFMNIANILPKKKNIANKFELTSTSI